MDTTTTFTAGPWEIDWAATDEGGNACFAICAKEAGYIAGIHTTEGVTLGPGDQANASLIASAPDLLAALEACSRIRLTSMLDAGEFQAIEWARTVIAKAKGA